MNHKTNCSNCYVMELIKKIEIDKANLNRLLELRHQQRNRKEKKKKDYYEFYPN